MKKKVGWSFLIVFIIAWLIPEPRIIPVQGATSNDWNKDTFWFEPWGSSGVHKGIDIFAASGTSVLATTHMVSLFKGVIPKGGKVILALGPKWRLHYFSHLQAIDDQAGWLIKKGDRLGGVGDSGNAKGKAPHLHYSIVSLVPLPWRIDSSTQGYKKAFYLNPIEYLEP